MRTSHTRPRRRISLVIVGRNTTRDPQPNRRYRHPTYKFTPRNRPVHAKVLVRIHNRTLSIAKPAPYDHLMANAMLPTRR